MDDSRIIRTEYSDLMQKSFIDYAMSVIVARALPDVRDGLKPVQRRVGLLQKTKLFQKKGNGNGIEIVVDIHLQTVFLGDAFPSAEASYGIRNAELPAEGIAVFGENRIVAVEQEGHAATHDKADEIGDLEI